MVPKTYRRTVSPENAEIYLDCLREALGKVDTTKLDFVGYLGSASLQGKPIHDIDVLTKLKGRKVGEEAKEYFKLHRIAGEKYSEIEDGFLAVPCPEKAQQELFNYIVDPAYSKEDMVPVHALIVIDTADLESHFPYEFKKNIKNSVCALHGNPDTLFSSYSGLSEPQKEPLYWAIRYMLDSRIDNLPEQLALESTESLLNYLKGKYPRLDIESTVPENIEEARIMNIGLMDLIDNWLYRTAGAMGARA